VVSGNGLPAWSWAVPLKGLSVPEEESGERVTVRLTEGGSLL